MYLCDIYNSSQFFEKQPDEICSHLSEKGSKGRVFFRAREAQKSNQRRKREEEKEKARRKKGGKEKKAMVALLLFMMATLEILTEKDCLFTFPSIILVFFFNHFFCQEIYC